MAILLKSDTLDSNFIPSCSSDMIEVTLTIWARTISRNGAKNAAVMARKAPKKIMI